MRMLIILLSSFWLVTTAFAAPSNGPSNLKNNKAIFAGGCFWCLQSDFDKVPGVISTISGYTGGKVKNPTYEQVSNGGTGHYESVQVIYNPNIVSYPQLLNVFWHSIDPTDASGQFCDKGAQYQAVIFYNNPSQEKLARTSKTALLASGRFKQIATKILPEKIFYPAEAYHQNYYKKNPLRYRFYRYKCGRDRRIKEVWSH